MIIYIFLFILIIILSFYITGSKEKIKINIDDIIREWLIFNTITKLWHKKYGNTREIKIRNILSNIYFAENGKLDLSFHIKYYKDSANKYGSFHKPFQNKF